MGCIGSMAVVEAIAQDIVLDLQQFDGFFVRVKSCLCHNACVAANIFLLAQYLHHHNPFNKQIASCDGLKRS